MGCDANFISKVQGMQGIEKLNIIFRLTTLQPARYEKLYGAKILPQIMENISSLEKMDTEKRKFKLYSEIYKILDVEDEIPAYFDRFATSPFSVILQKFNSYAGRVRERRVSDLTPLHRDFCWHLARDIYMDVRGSVPLCKQDPFSENTFSADFNKFSIQEIVAKTAVYHSASVRGDHSAIAMPCLKCDEWYTFNA